MFRSSLFCNAWLRLLRAYFVSFAFSFTAGIILITVLGIAPETILEISTKRVSYVFPILEAGASYGIDEGIFLFVWNTLGACITISFLYTAPLFNPQNISNFPQNMRKIFCGRKRMKLLCFLPGCLPIEEESLRRLYVWLMIPWLGMILLGMESGLTVATASSMFESYLIGFISLIPHGIIEIPTIAFAGAITFSAHLLVKEKVGKVGIGELFKAIENYTNSVPLQKYILIIIVCLFIAGLVEAHITNTMLDSLLASNG
ncbi:MAG: stage II sporulation protein M [Desulfocapsa sp.]|nr:stage II sporulation protein M [Desulfocapsa sp.]